MKKANQHFFYESHIAEDVYDRMVAEENIDVRYNLHVTSVNKDQDDSAIHALKLNDSLVIEGRIFIDCSYEGDLMARSGVSYTYGRESKSKYNESYAGIRFMDDTLKVKITNEKGQRLPNHFSDPEQLEPGAGDNRVMAYNFRPTMTKRENNKVPVTRPENYDSTRYALLANYLENHPNTDPGDLIGIYPRRNGKFEFNNKQGAIISIGLLGGNVEYPDAGYEKRREIVKEHRQYTLGYLYFLGHDPRVPKSLQKEMLSYGFAKDEFKDNDHFPYYLYVREARRMKGEFVLTQHDILSNRTKQDAVTLGSHWIDSHHVQRVAIDDSGFTNEGRIWHKITRPFEIPYSVLLSKKKEIKNLLVPVCSSLSHVAFCAYRLEPTWMEMGHVAGTAAGLALKNQVPLHNLEVDTLQSLLKREGMILKIENLGDYEDYSE